MHAFSCFLHSMATSIMFCCRLCEFVPDINEVLLELINIVHTAFIHSLHNTPELIIIHRNQV